MSRGSIHPKSLQKGMEGSRGVRRFEAMAGDGWGEGVNEDASEELSRIPVDC